MNDSLVAISLGWGVQSWTLAAMSALGELPPVDVAIHSDTTWEHEATYQFAERWTPWLEERGVPVVTVSNARAARQLISAENQQTHAPLFTLSESGAGHGQLRRSCTHRWKIQPMRRWLSAELERRGVAKAPGVVEQWLGISLDEFRRMKDSDVRWVRHRFPLVERRLTRAGCLAWLERHDLPSPGKSACTFCPYHSLAAWQHIKREGGADWQQALEVDAAIRDKRPPYPLYVHPARKPLDEAVMIPEDVGAKQLLLFDEIGDDAPCDSGYCFL